MDGGQSSSRSYGNARRAVQEGYQLPRGVLEQGREENAFVEFQRMDFAPRIQVEGEQGELNLSRRMIELGGVQFSPCLL